MMLSRQIAQIVACETASIKMIQDLSSIGSPAHYMSPRSRLPSRRSKTGPERVAGIEALLAKDLCKNVTK